ncbi:putative AC transposase, partial [Rhizoctonia solani 123E]
MLPDPTTLRRDTQRVYEQNMQAIRCYFRKIDHIHLAMDGWTAPTSRSYLGIVIIWQNMGEMHRAILEFIQLKKRHTGEYLAQRTSECLNKYELGSKLLTVCMDNASNNNTFTTELQRRFPSFGGPKFRSRCGAHISNLMAK